MKRLITMLAKGCPKMKSNTAQKLFPILVLLVLICQQSHAQEAGRSWLSAGVFFLGGEKPFFSSYAEAADISFHYQLNANLFSIRALWTGNLCFTCDETTEFWDISVLYGRSTISEYFHASIAGGLGIIGGHRVDDFGQRKDVATTVGAALQAQLFLHISRTFGIGIYGFANINSETQLYGATLNLHFGKLID